MKVIRILILLISLMVCHNASAYDYEYNGFYFNLNAAERTATVTYKTTSYNSYSGNIDIPDYFPGPKDIEYTVVAIGDNAFRGCTGVKKLVIPNTVTEIGNNAFYGCTGITTMSLPQMVSSIGSYAFYNCTYLSSIKIPDFMTTISANMFEKCIRLTSIIIPRNVTTIEASAFSGCTGLVSVSLPSGVSSIGNNAFQNCSSLSEITLPNNLSSIGSSAFSGCSRLSSLSITSGVQSIGQDAFSNTGIKSLVYEQGCTTALRTYATSITEVKLASTVKDIPENAFNNSTALTAVDLPENISTIGNSAFYGCSSLSKLYLPSSVKTIGNNAFAQTGIKMLEYAEGSNVALRTYATEIVSVIIPSSITSFESGAFTGCKKLENVHIYNLELWNYIMRHQNANPFECPHRIYNNGNVLISLNADFGCEIAKYAFSNCIGLKYVNLTPSITAVEDYAFAGCPDLEAVVIGSGVEYIGVNAFQGCTSLQSVRLGAGLKTIKDNAFYGCKLMNSLLFGGNEEKIGASAFAGCSSLPMMSLPETITSIGASAFKDCVALQSVKLPNGITKVEDYTFDGCVELQRAEMSTALTTVGKYAFRNCDRLHVIELPDCISTISDYGFNDCDSLAYVYMGTGIKSIGSYSFANCKRIVSVYCRATEKPSCQSTAFSNSDPAYIDLYVPDEMVSNYASAAPWNTFGTKKGLSSAPTFVTNITLSSPVVILEEGDTKKLSVTVNPSDATNTRVYWSSSNSAVAYVNNTGTILANEQGTATITIKAADNNGAVAKGLVLVSNYFKPLTDISLSQNDAVLQEGRKLSLIADVAPLDATYSGVTWNSSNPDVAQVGSDGVVKAIKSGTAEITCSASDGNGAAATCSIEVIPPVDPVIGDANEDGRVSVSDISHVANVILSYSQKNPNFSIFDVNEDGEITVSDITGIASIILNGGIGATTKVLELSTNKMTIGVNDIQQLGKTVVPYRSMLSYQSNNPDVATVDNFGNIRGISGGIATITVSAADGSGLSASCEVTVDASYGSTDGHAWVDLALPSGTRWATANLGANTAGEYGQHYAWGETDTKENYTWSTYSHCEGTATSLTKYCNAASKGKRDNIMQLQAEDNAAIAEWGDEWSMPTKAQFEELFNADYTTWTWEEQNGIMGYKVMSRINGNSIFLPAAGYVNKETLDSSNSGGYYSTKDLCEEDASYNWTMNFGSSKIGEITKTYRAYGQSVRPVRSSYIKMSETKVRMDVGDERQLFAHVEGKDSLSKISWRSDDENIATVTAGGMVKLVANGTVRIYAETGTGLCAYCTITSYPDNYTFGMITNEQLNRNNPIDLNARYLYNATSLNTTENFWGCTSPGNTVKGIKHNWGDDINDIVWHFEDAGNGCYYLVNELGAYLAYKGRGSSTSYAVPTVSNRDSAVKIKVLYADNGINLLEQSSGYKDGYGINDAYGYHTYLIWWNTEAANEYSNNSSHHFYKLNWNYDYNTGLLPDWQSTNHSNSSTSSYNYRLKAEKGQTMSFDWTVSSESKYDWLVVTLNGTEILKKSGSDSGKYTYTFTSDGIYSVCVTYTKDGSNSSGSDMATIKNFKVEGYSTVDNSAELSDFNYNYNAKKYNASTHTISYDTNAKINKDMLLTNSVDCHGNYITIANKTYGTIQNYSSSLDRLNLSNSSQMTFIAKVQCKLTTGESTLIGNRNGSNNYNYLIRQKANNGLYFHDANYSSTGSNLLTYSTQPTIIVVRIDSNGTITMESWTDGIKTTRPTKLNIYASNSSQYYFFAEKVSVLDSFWSGDFYWAYNASRYLDDKEIQKVIDYNENS